MRGERNKMGDSDRDRGNRPYRGHRTIRYELPKDTIIDYKNLNVLQKFVTDRGKILPRRISGISTKQQKLLAIAIKQARYLALLPVGTAKRK